MELTVPVEGGHLWADDTGADGLSSCCRTGDREYPMVARWAAEIAARIPGCEHVPAPGADHMLPPRVPDLIAKLAITLAG